MNLFTQNIAEVSVVYKNTVKASDRPKISCSRDASEIMRNYMNDGNLQIEHREYFFILLLNRAKKVLGVSTVSIGRHVGNVGLQPNSDTKLQKLKCGLLTCNKKKTEYENKIHS